MILLYVRLENFQFLNLNSEQQVFRTPPSLPHHPSPYFSQNFSSERSEIISVFLPIFEHK